MGPLLAALVVASTVTASQPPAPSSGAGGAQQQHKPEEHSPAASSTENQSAPSVVVNVGTSQGAHIQTSGKGENEHKDSSPEWWIAGATVALAAITAALAIFTALLWGSTRKLVVGADDNARRQLRAYVSASPDYVDEFSAASVRLRVSLVNHGQTPANNVRTVVRVEILPYPLPETFAFDKITAPTWTTGATIHPGKSELTVGAHVQGGFTVDEITAAAQDAGCRVYCWGVVFYEDAFQERQTTEFCRSIVGSENLRHVINDPSVKRELTFEVATKHNEAT